MKCTIMDMTLKETDIIDFFLEPSAYCRYVRSSPLSPSLRHPLLAFAKESHCCIIDRKWTILVDYLKQ